MYIDIGIVGVILLIGWTVKYFVEQHRKRAEDRRTEKMLERYEREREKENEAFFKKVDGIIANQKEWERAQGWKVDDEG